MLVGTEDLGWVLQDHKPLLFSDQDTAEQHATVLNKRTPDATYRVAPWPVGVEGGR
jgi:hypothetical protein